MPLKMKYFVLKPRSKVRYDPWAAASRAAMRTYATMIEIVDPILSKELKTWVKKEEKEETLYPDPENYEEK